MNVPRLDRLDCHFGFHWACGGPWCPGWVSTPAGPPPGPRQYQRRLWRGVDNNVPACLLCHQRFSLLRARRPALNGPSLLYRRETCFLSKLWVFAYGFPVLLRRIPSNSVSHRARISAFPRLGSAMNPPGGGGLSGQKDVFPQVSFAPKQPSVSSTPLRRKRIFSPL